MITRRAIARAALGAALAVAPSILRAQPAGGEAAVTREVQSYFSAMGRGDIAALERALAPEYAVIGGDGKVEGRAERLAWLRRNTGKLTMITPTEVKVRLYDRTAVATGLVTIPADASGPAIRERFTQVWVRRGSAWQMVAGQITIVRTP